jgi:hypothetical protein
MRISVLLLALWSVTAAAAPSTRLAATRPAVAPAAAAISAGRIRADIEFLADDLLEGRETGTRGYDIAARFAANALKAAGYRPAADDGTFFQSVPLLESTLTAGILALTSGARQEVPIPAEALLAPSAMEASVRVSAPVVFAGFGVTAPERGYDDYAGLDVAGKIVAILSNAPAAFASEPRAHYASSEQKLRMAADHGAVAVLTLLSQDALRRRPWTALVARAAQPSITWANDDGSPGPAERRIRAIGYLNQEGAARLFAGAPVAFEQVVSDAAAGRVKGVALATTVTIETTSTHRSIRSANVIGRLAGRDPALSATSVLLTAHLDHLGMLPAGAGDRINNGAYDNATGSAIVLEVARALSASPQRPRRSVVVALLTGEEKGLLGSDYLARHPVSAAGAVIADVNLDMPVFLTGATDLVAFGAEHSSLEAVVRTAARRAGFTLSPDPLPEENVFVRSDQYSFVKQGVPSVYLMPGFTAKDPTVKGAEIFEGFLAKHYHRPSDDLTLPMDLEAMRRFAEVNLAIARAIADDPVAPAWKTGDFFGTLFGGER